MAAYIDLNPVRAGLCADPKDYRYCGYAEALGKGSLVAHQGIRTILGQPDSISWVELSRQTQTKAWLQAPQGCDAFNRSGFSWPLGLSRSAGPAGRLALAGSAYQPRVTAAT